MMNLKGKKLENEEVDIRSLDPGLDRFKMNLKREKED